MLLHRRLGLRLLHLPELRQLLGRKERPDAADQLFGRIVALCELHEVQILAGERVPEKGVGGRVVQDLSVGLRGETREGVGLSARAAWFGVERFE